MQVAAADRTTAAVCEREQLAAVSGGASDDNHILEGAYLTSKIRSAYSETVHWHRNIFLVPSGATGKEFILELAKFFQA